MAGQPPSWNPSRRASASPSSRPRPPRARRRGTTRCTGAPPCTHPMSAGPVGTNGGTAGNRLAREADVVLCVGTRLGDFVTASRTTLQNPPATFVAINVGPMDAHKQRAVPVVADAREGLRALDAALVAAA